MLPFQFMLEHYFHLIFLTTATAPFTTFSALPSRIAVFQVLRPVLLMSVAQREAGRSRPSTLKLPRKPSARDLRSSSRTHLDGRLNSGKEVPPVPISTAPKKSPGRGLTIDTGTCPQTAESGLALKSAPAGRTIRRLPSLPVPLPTRPSISPSPSGTFNAPRHTSMAPLLSREKRPLPSLPPPKTRNILPTVDTTVAPSSSLPPSRRTSKPLPTPVQKTGKDSSSDLPSLDGLQPIQESDATPPPTPPKNNTLSPSPFRTPKRKPPQNTSPANDTPTPKTPKRSLAQALRSKDAPTAVMLHTRMILERNQKLDCISMPVDDDNFSEDSFSGVTITEPVFKPPHGHTVVRKTSPRKSGDAPEVVGIVSDKDQKHSADYAFVLANRILYQQTSNDGRSMLTSKWVREVKGKRYTEQNFDNVMKALRTL